MVQRVEYFSMQHNVMKQKMVYTLSETTPWNRKWCKRWNVLGQRQHTLSETTSWNRKWYKRRKCFGPKAAYALGGVCGQTEAVQQVDAATTVPFEQYPCPSPIHSTTSSVSRTFAILLIIGSSMRQILNKKNRTVKKPCCLKKYRMK